MATRSHSTSSQVTATTDKVTVEKQVLGPPRSDRTTIYHKETGAPMEVYAVDAREILAQENSEYTDQPPSKDKKD